MEKIFEEDRVNENGLHSKTLIFRKRKSSLIGFVEIQSWASFFPFLTLALLAGMLAAAYTIVYNAPNPGNYLDSCEERSCNKDLNLKCINNVCTCTSTQFFLNKCYEKKSYNEICSKDFECLAEPTCRNGKCQCSEYEYFAQNNCVKRKSFDETCVGDQCLNNLMLFCNRTITKCRCPATRFWDGNVCVAKRFYGERCANTQHCDESKYLSCDGVQCVCNNASFFSNNTCLPKRTYNQNCFNTSQCDDSKNLTCINQTCLCDYLQYFTDICHFYKSYLEPCSKSIECLNNMTCVNGKCSCEATEYYDATTSSCPTRKTYLESCSGDQCIAFSALYCNLSLGRCDCNLTTSFWNGSSCVPKRSYNESCLATYQCDETKVLQCFNGICQCNSTYFYFDKFSSKCLARLNENQVCYDSLQCLGELSCISGKCQCTFDKYYHAISMTCANKTLNGTSCSTSTTCRDDLGLSCQTNICQCSNSTYFYWDTITLSCLPKSEYNTSCVSSISCLSNLKCLNSICECVRVFDYEEYWNGMQCAFAKTYGSFCLALGSIECRFMTESTQCISGKCDCYRVYQNESYWDGNMCQPAKDYNISCNGSTECKTLTQQTTCVSNKCDCFNGKFDTVAESCKFCDIGWSFYENKCYITQTGLSLVSDMIKSCNKLNYTSSSLASMTSNALIAFVNSKMATTYAYVAVTSISSNSIVNCALLSGSLVYDHACDHNHDFICEYTL